MRYGSVVRRWRTQLENAELVFRCGESPEAVYIFKRALAQDTVYESLLKSRRQILRRRIGETPRDRFPPIAETEPEVVTDHLTQAGFTAAAAEWCGKAGAWRWADQPTEAIACLERALHLAERLPDSAGERQTSNVGGVQK